MFKEVHIDGIEARASAPQIAELLARYRALCVHGALPHFDQFDSSTSRFMLRILLWWNQWAAAIMSTSTMARPSERPPESRCSARKSVNGKVKLVCSSARPTTRLSPRFDQST